MNICKIDGCSKKVKGYGFCQKHYVSMRENGELFKIYPNIIFKKCIVFECNQIVVAKGLCKFHYHRDKFNSHIPLENPPKHEVRHGFSRHLSYRTWQCMMARCYNSKNISYKSHGARGIKVCNRWHKIENFIEDMGERPKGLSLDRIDNNGDYAPLNCRWATAAQQVRNRRDNILSDKKVKEIRAENKLFSNRKERADFVKELSKKYNISIHKCNAVLNNTIWKD